MSLYAIKTSIVVLAVCTMMSCSKEAAKTTQDTKEEALTASEKALISGAGLNADWAEKTDDGYLIEGDILMTAQELQDLQGKTNPTLIVANAEQYHTTNLVKGLPRAIRIYYGGNSQRLSEALDKAITRYNNMVNLRISFVRTNNEANTRITIKMAPGLSDNTIAQANFPTNAGDPFHTIKFNPDYTSWEIETLTTILAHEMGHCIGFRHTDYMDRSFSCGGKKVNEGGAGIGAIRIPGTPAGPEANSWMLACFNNGVNRPFTANDREALKYLY